MAENAIEWKKGICGVCPAACWVEIGLKNGKIVDIREDDSHPLGMICHRGKHAPEIVYSSHRLKYPMKRKGPKGTYGFERISWDEAYDTIVSNLNNIKQESGPEAVSIYTGRGAFELSLCDMYQPADAAVSSASNMLFPFGSPNTMGVGALCYVSFAMIAPHVTMGRMLINMYTDIENASTLIIWGTNPATDSPPLDMHRLELAVKRGAEVIGIDPKKSEAIKRTGAEWIPIRPGTDGALALGMIHQIIEEEIYDRDFADNWCYGFDELKQYVQHFRPEMVEEITGIPADKIIRLARKIADSNAACPVMYTGLEYSNSGIQAIRAVTTLFALAGHLDVPGGIGLGMPDSQFTVNKSCNQQNPALEKAVARDKFPLYSKYRGESHASGLIDAVLKKDPYPIRGLIIHGGSICTSWPQTEVWEKALSGLDFQVCIDRQLTADAKYADIVLPATTMFEIDSYCIYGSIFRLREKIIEPVGEARNDYLIMAELARKLGYGHLYPQSEKEMVEFVLQGTGYSLKDIKKAGGWVQKDSPSMEYRKWEKGLLRADGKKGFDTPSGKFEIRSGILEEYGYEPLPKYKEVKEGPLERPDLLNEFPLVFNSGARTQTDFRSQHHGIKGLNQDHPEPRVEMNPVDAGKRNIKTGDLVEVRTQRGAVPFRALVTDEIAAGSVECNQGGGTPVGPKSWQKWNVNYLTDINNYDEISGFPVYKALLCEVTKTGEATKQSVKTTSKKVEKDDSASGMKAKHQKRRIYLDNNATTRMAMPVREAMDPYLQAEYGNPSSIHSLGGSAREAVENARRQLARLINAKPGNIVFTGGGSEADNLAIKGLAFKIPEKKHIVTSRIEHPAVLNTCRFLESIGYDITYLDIDEKGLINPEDFEKAVRSDTLLASLMLANNEVGSIQDIKKLSEIAHAHNIIFHTDAVQAAGKIKLDVESLQVDLLTLSGHKFHGPKGIGALYIRPGITLEPLIHGGKQEAGLRAGTENIASIVGMGKAAELAIATTGRENKISALRDKLEAGLRDIKKDIVLNGDPRNRLPNTLSLILPKMRGESVVIAMDRQGISLSSGSACRSGSPEPTHVLLAMGKSEEEAHCAVRFSLSDETTEEEIDYTIRAFAKMLEEMKTTVRFLSCK